MIETIGMEKIAGFIESEIKHCEYEKDGVTQTIGIYSVNASSEGIKILVYFDHTIIGDLTNFKLITNDDQTFASEVDLISKSGNKGWVLAFDYKLREVAV